MLVLEQLKIKLFSYYYIFLPLEAIPTQVSINVHMHHMCVVVPD